MDFVPIEAFPKTSKGLFALSVPIPIEPDTVKSPDISTSPLGVMVPEIFAYKVPDATSTSPVTFNFLVV